MLSFDQLKTLVYYIKGREYLWDDDSLREMKEYKEKRENNAIQTRDTLKAQIKELQNSLQVSEALNYELSKELTAAKEMEIERQKQEAIDWLVERGVDIELIQRLLDSKKLEIATVEEAKRQFLRLIEMCDSWDGVDVDFLLDQFKKEYEASNNKNIFDDQIRKFIKKLSNKRTEDELMLIVERKFGKAFKFSWTRAYVKKNKTKVDTYVRILFK